MCTQDNTSAAEILVKPSLNEEQMQAVYTQDNTVVVAGAGSGKTTVLASRIMHLMIEKQIPLSRILALTFTNKATTEMYERIYKHLTNCIQEQIFQGASIDDATLDFLKKQREIFHDNHIVTLDSFSLHIAQIGIARMGHIAPLGITEDLREHIALFVERWLLSHTHSHIKTLLQYIPFDTLVHKILVPMLEKGSCFPVDLTTQCADIFDRARKDSIETFDTIKNSVQELEIIVANNVSNIQDASDSIKKLVESLQKTKAAIQEASSLEGEALYKHRIPMEISLKGVTRSKQLRAYSTDIKESKARLGDAISFYHAIQDSLAHTKHFEQYYQSLQEIANDWHLYREDAGLYDYNDIAEIARKSLSEYEDIRAWYAKKFDCIIIDEFQDNNQEQKKLLYMLSNVFVSDSVTAAPHTPIPPNKYFFVGDPKQSIYGFRGADIGAFLSLKHYNTELEMTTNYRSSHQLVSLFNTWFNILFESLESQEGHHISYAEQRSSDTPSLSPHTSEAQEERYSPVSSVLSNKEQQQFESRCSADKTVDPRQICCVVDLIEKQEDTEIRTWEKREIEAFNIVSRIRNMINNNIPPQDIAILSGKKKIFSYIAKYLFMYDIPFEMEDSHVSLRQDVGQDFYSWLSLLLYPHDRAAYTAVLRSPLAHLDDEVVISLLAYRTKTSEDTLFHVPSTPSSDEVPEHYRALQGYLIDHKKGMQTLALLREKYLEAKKILRSYSVLEVLQHFWNNCGYRYVLMRNKRYHTFLSNYEVLKMLILDYHTEGAVAVHSHIRELLNEQSPKNKVTKSSLNNNAIQIMTIHKSKGLEFPHVIVADLDSSFRSPVGDFITYSDKLLYAKIPFPYEPYHLLRDSAHSKSANSIFSHALTLSRKKDIGEFLRILYVAFTRAERTLILSSYTIQSKKKREDITISSILKWLYKYGVLINRTHTEENVVLDTHHIEWYKKEELIAQEIQDFLETQGKNETRTVIRQKIETTLKEATLLHHEQKEMRVSPSRGVHEQYLASLSPQPAEILPDLEVDNFLKKYHIQAVFGVYCHFLLSYYCKNEPPPMIPVKLEVALLPLSTQERTLFIETAEAVSKKFIHSELWQSIDTDAKIYSEHPFSLWNETHQVHVQGIIDLLVVSKEKITIIDYKSNKNRDIASYVYQLGVYRLVAEQLYSDSHDVKQIETQLFFLRSSDFSEITRSFDEDELIGKLIHHTNDIEEKDTLSDLDSIEIITE